MSYGFAIAAMGIGCAGCGTNLESLLLQSGDALGRSYIDALLTDIANTLAEQLEQQGQPGNGDTGNGDTGNGDTGGDPGALTGDPAAGQTVYDSNTCGACHCADATGGCALSAPGLIGAGVTTLDENLRGGLVHPAKPPLSDQEIADLSAYLNSL